MSTAAQQLAQWIGATHPELYQLLFERAVAQRLAGFGDDLEFTPDIPDVSLSSTGDIPDFTLTAADLPAPDMSSSLSPDVTDIPIGTESTGGGFLSTVGSGIASAASAVGNFLTSPAAAKAAGAVATAYFQLQNNKVNAQVQTQILQAQIARAQSGLAPLPIGYATNTYGQTVPVYQTPAGGMLPSPLSQAYATGQSQYIPGYGYTIPPSTLPSLTGSVSLTQLLPWLLLLGGALILAKEL